MQYKLIRKIKRLNIYTAYNNFGVANFNIKTDFDKYFQLEVESNKEGASKLNRGKSNTSLKIRWKPFHKGV